MNTTSTLKEYRCRQCSKLLFKGVLVESTVEVKCKGCRALSTFTGEPANKYVCLVYPCPNRVSAGLAKKELE
ncbi:MAG: hypothetical protein Q8P33_03545 [bacterium]|nr:hypothetical protein [bacterium]